MNESVSELLAISPDDIKFHFKHGLFLLRVMSNENDSAEMLRKAW